MKYFSQSYFASCPTGLEEQLVNEIKSCDITQFTIQNGGISFESSYIDAVKLIFNSRIANKVYKKIFSFNFSSEKDIYTKGKLIKWHEIFSVSQSFKIDCVITKNSTIKNNIYASQLLKDAIADKFREIIQKRPKVDKNDPHINIMLHIDKQALIYLDLCGTALHKRGYRQKTGRAPIKENLAAGILSFMDIKNKNDVFIDSMCGSGTFLIETALIKANIPPSYLKLTDYEKGHYDNLWSFLDHNQFNDDKKLISKTEQEIKACLNKTKQGLNNINNNTYKIYGYDIHQNIIDICERNLEKSLLINSIKIQKQDAKNIEISPDEQGVIFCNPPYGERLDNLTELENLYYNYGENLKNNFKNFKAYIFTGNSELRKKIALRTSRRIKLYNGAIECRLLEYILY